VGTSEILNGGVHDVMMLNASSFIKICFVIKSWIHYLF